MAPSIRLDFAGAYLGYTSASMDASKAAGASGNWPSTAWLPMTMRSCSLAIAAAARRMCSSAARFIGLQDGPALFAREQTRERARLPQPCGLFGRRAEQRRHLRQRGLIQEPSPFEQGRRGVRLEPAPQVVAGDLQQRRIRLEFRSHCLVERETATVDPVVRTHTVSIGRTPTRAGTASNPFGPCEQILRAGIDQIPTGEVSNIATRSRRVSLAL